MPFRYASTNKVANKSVFRSSRHGFRPQFDKIRIIVLSDRDGVHSIYILARTANTVKFRYSPLRCHRRTFKETYILVYLIVISCRSP